MFTINAEKELIKLRDSRLKKEAVEFKKQTEQDNLLVQEAEAILAKCGEEELRVLSRMGLDRNLVKYNRVKPTLVKFKELNEKKIFKLEEIQKICLKYNLRFLRIGKYAGSVDPVVPSKVIDFESKYSGSEYYICADPDSFELRPYPRDPMLFGKLGDDSYYLIHKWGNDLSLVNRLKGIWMSYKWKNFYIQWIMSTLCFLVLPYLMAIVFSFSNTAIIWVSVVGMIAGLIWTVIWREKVLNEGNESIESLWDTSYS